MERVPKCDYLSLALIGYLAGLTAGQGGIEVRHFAACLRHTEPHVG
jgi:hypothetical protein